MKIKIEFSDYEKLAKLINNEKNFYYYTCPTDWWGTYYDVNSTIEI